MKMNRLYIYRRIMWYFNLQNGNYEQATKKLRAVLSSAPLGADKTIGYCCLGVAEDMVLQACGQDWGEEIEGAPNENAYFCTPLAVTIAESTDSSQAANEWFGLDVSTEEEMNEAFAPPGCSLAVLNDEGLNFYGISEIVKGVITKQVNECTEYTYEEKKELLDLFWRGYQTVANLAVEEENKMKEEGTLTEFQVVNDDES